MHDVFKKDRSLAGVRRRTSLGFLKIINNEPALINLRPNKDTPMLTAIHEAGHFLDISGIDEIGKMAEDKIGETLADWWSAITKAMHIMSW